MEAQLGQGVYTFPEAARLTRLGYARVREWFRGRTGNNGRKPIFYGDYDPVGGDCALSFHDLVELFVAGQLREHGVSLQTLRRVHARMKKDLDSLHPFCRQELLSDGKVVFMRNVDNAGVEELTEALTRQKVFPQILLPFLERIDYDKVTVLARRWRIGKQVVVDPAICFGKPVIESAGVPTSILAAAYLANNRDADLVGDWFNISPHQVLAAVEFENKMAA